MPRRGEGEPKVVIRNQEDPSKAETITDLGDEDAHETYIDLGVSQRGVERKVFGPVEDRKHKVEEVRRGIASSGVESTEKKDEERIAMLSAESTRLAQEAVKLRDKLIKNSFLTRLLGRKKLAERYEDTLVRHEKVTKELHRELRKK